MTALFLANPLEVRPSPRLKSVRESARMEAKDRLHGYRSIFDTVTTEQAASFASNVAPATAGCFDPLVSTYEPLE
jgi:hypothetical protein